MEETRDEKNLGYVVIGYNQASKQPYIIDGSFTDDFETADEVASEERERTASVGRGETYSVARVREIAPPT